MPDAKFGKKIADIPKKELENIVTTSLPELQISSITVREGNVSVPALVKILGYLEKNEYIEQAIEDYYDSKSKDHGLKFSYTIFMDLARERDVKVDVYRDISVIEDDNKPRYCATISTKRWLFYHPQVSFGGISQETKPILFLQKTNAQKGNDYKRDSTLFREETVDLGKGNSVEVFVPIIRNPEVAETVSVFSIGELRNLVDANGVFMDRDTAKQLRIRYSPCNFDPKKIYESKLIR